VPADLVVRYDDLHFMHGGLAITVRGDGTWERAEMPHRKPGRGPEQRQGRLPPARLLPLIRLLVQLEAWKQLTPARPPVPDESAARLDISVAGQSANMWEWYNEMYGNDRLIRIRKMMRAVLPKK
jgi:hypothetical protein